MGGRFAALVGLVLALFALTSLTSSPAMAGPASPAGCTRFYSFDGAQIQIDNCPGSGVSWAWVLGSANHGSSGWTELNVSFANGVSQYFTADANKAAQNGFGWRITSFKVCTKWWVGWSPPLPIGVACSVDTPVS